MAVCYDIMTLLKFWAYVIQKKSQQYRSLLAFTK